MTRLLSSLGAFGASYALFSYFGGGALPYAICAAFLAPFFLSLFPDCPAGTGCRFLRSLPSSFSRSRSL